MMKVKGRLMRFRNLTVLWITCLILSFTIAAAGAQAKDTPKSQSKQARKTKIQSRNLEKNKKKKLTAPKIHREKKGVQAKAVICVNLYSNETILARNPDQQLPVASLTKLVTALVTLDRMELNKKVTVPDHIKSIPKSVVGLKAGDEISVQDLLHGLLIGSGNDCAETLACAYPGGRAKFVTAMNKKVRSMGMRKTKFFTPSGLDHKVKAEDEVTTCEVDSNVSTAREIAGIAKEAFENNTIRSICLKKNYVMASNLEQNGYSVRTTNKLLRDRLPLIGGKTGYTAKAGHCLASEFRPGKNAFLIVVLGSPDHFRDTRLVYHKALQATNKIRLTPVSASGRMAAKQLY
jgi:D-alanyl-D-alanine carboxypeptidase